MKFTCEKYLLQLSVATASRAALAKSAVPALEGLLIEAGVNLCISGYDLKTGIRATIDADIIDQGDIVLNARLFGEIIRRLPDELVTITVNDRCMAVIECGMSQFEIMGFPASDYPELPTVDVQNAISVSEKLLKSMIAQTNFAVSDNESRPIHTGSLFEVDGSMLTVVAVDGYRLAMRREHLKTAMLRKAISLFPARRSARWKKSRRKVIIRLQFQWAANM
jgi:DNA polymerase-3 subunit beta